MESQNELEIGIGTKEATTLKPAQVRIVDVRIVEVGEKRNKKLVCDVKHPDKLETIKISAVKYEKNKGQLEEVGLWINKDEDSLIAKGSALAVFMNSLHATTLNDLKDKEVLTTDGERGFLCFKVY